MALMRILALFLAMPFGLTAPDVTDRLRVSHRPVQRDLLHVQSNFTVPFVQIGARWTVPSEFFLGAGHI